MRSAPALAVALVCLATGGACHRPRPAPSVPPSGAERVAGDLLIARHACTACHAAPATMPAFAADAGERTAPRLASVGARLRPDGIRAFLADPQALRPGTPMPDLLARVPPDGVDALAAFLADLGGGDGSGAPRSLDLVAVERGRHAYHEVGCVACHAPFEDAESLDASLWEFGELGPSGADASGMAPEESDGPTPDRLALRRVADLYDFDGLVAYLVDPLAVRPDGRMPDLDLSQREATDLAAYLWFERAYDLDEVAVDWSPGLRWERFDGGFDHADLDRDPASLGDRPPDDAGVTDVLGALPPHPDEHFALRLRGFVDVPETGVWLFATTSDDGSWLFVDGERVVDNGGLHGEAEATGQVHLEAGRHSLEVVYYEWGGDEVLVVEWEGPGRAREVVPADRLLRADVVVPPALRGERRAAGDELAARGRGWFASLGCAACHGDAGVAPPPPSAPAFAELRGTGGCLAEEPQGALPRFALAAEDRARLARHAAASAALAPYTPEQELAATLGRLACARCHARDGAGGPPEARRSYFRVASDAELGDEGRIPPALDRVGWKLEETWLEEVLTGADGAGRVRPYMITRMPRFGRENVGRLPSLFARLDATGHGSPPDAVPPAGAADRRELIRAGQRLAGTRGLGCIQCHEFGDYESLGIPAVDLTEVHGRIRYPWFRELLLDPVALGMNTRMPAFWRPGGASPVKDVLGGDTQAQVGALWSYLSLGSAMPVPEGLVADDGDYELVPEDEPIAVGVFWKNASPRTLVVGHPELVHYAYDVEHSRLVTAWRGRFFNAAGTWHGRGGTLEEPPTDDVLELPPGAPFGFAEGASPSSIRAVEPRPLGRRYDADRRPVFRYAFEGVEVEESIVPRASGAVLGLERRFVLRAERAVEGLVLRTAGGPRPVPFERADGGWTTEIREELSW